MLQANSSEISPECNDFSDFGKSVNKLQILTRFLLGFCLEIFKDFESADKVGVCNFGLKHLVHGEKK